MINIEWTVQGVKSRMAVPNLQRHLVLFHYFLDLLGARSFDWLKTYMRTVTEGTDEYGRSYFAEALIQLKDLKISRDKLLMIDQRIQGHLKRLKKNRLDDSLAFKYFQYLALLFTEFYLDHVFGSELEQQVFLRELNEFSQKWQEKNRVSAFPPFKKEELKKIAYWMATGSGKTLVMHVNYWQVLERTRGTWDNIILITPNEGLSRQHHLEMKKSGIPCKRYDENIGNPRTKPDEVLIIDIYKLTEEKKGEGMTIDVKVFDGRNLVFIDEGHKGQKSEERKWKRLREELGKNGFIFEYSATFGQVIGKNEYLLEEYAKAIIFDYSYKHFYLDGYGKDFYVFTLKQESREESYRDLLLTACLLAYLEQLVLFHEHREILRQEYHVEKPLWIFVGSKVTGKKLESDVIQVLQYLRKVVTETDAFEKLVQKILSGQSGLTDAAGNDIFQDKFWYLKRLHSVQGLDSFITNLYNVLFHGHGSLEIHEIKNAEGELAIKLTDAEDYFGVINVGNTRKLRKLLENDGFVVKEDHFTSSLFFNINAPDSSIHLLIGSKKFVEGWNSWRVSTMGLMNMGKGEGPQIIQLFGRGVRLKGKKHSLKRETGNDVPYPIKMLQILWIFGLNADYINLFLKKLAEEDVKLEESATFFDFKLYNQRENYRSLIEGEDQQLDHSERPFILELDQEVIRRVTVDFRPFITAARGFSVEHLDVNAGKSTPFHLTDEILDALNWNDIFLQILEFKHERELHDLIILSPHVLRDIAKSRQYRLFLPPNLQSPRRFEDFLCLHDVMLAMLKAYIVKFYRSRRRMKNKP